MSILHRIPRSELERQFTHYGWFLGLVPVYIANPDAEGPVITERNLVPEWCFTVAEALFALFTYACEAVDPTHVPAFPLLITGTIERRGR